VFGFANDVVADAMVGSAAEPCFSSTELLEMALGALGAARLQRRLERAHTLARALDSGAAERLAIAICRQVDDA
jgi:hypothetical protein